MPTSQQAPQVLLEITELEHLPIEASAPPTTEFELVQAGTAGQDADTPAGWATSAQLIEAFPQFLKVDRFRKLEGWLLDARRRKGEAGRRGRPALFCPYAVMLGLTTKMRGRRLPKVRGWHVLREQFPDA